MTLKQARDAHDQAWKLFSHAQDVHRRAYTECTNAYTILCATHKTLRKAQADYWAKIEEARK